MNCTQCQKKINLLGNYGTDNTPMCFDCNEKKKEELLYQGKDDFERKAIKEEIENRKTENTIKGISLLNKIVYEGTILGFICIPFAYIYWLIAKLILRKKGKFHFR